jgi:hypothetical protein
MVSTISSVQAHFSGDWLPEIERERISPEIPYLQDAKTTFSDQERIYERSETSGEPMPGPRKYRHTLSTLMNGLAEYGFVIRHLSEDVGSFRCFCTTLVRFLDVELS